MRGSNALFAIPLLLFLSCTAVHAQDTGNLVGQIRLRNGSFPAERILITLQTRGATLNSMYTDNEGRFGFYNLLPNPYHVVVEDENYEPFHQVVIINPTVLQTTQIHVVLVPREKPKPESPPAAASGGNPHLVNLAEYGKKFPREAIKEFEAGVKADESGQSEKAIAHYQEALRLAPAFYPAHNNLGIRYLSKGDFAAAENEFREVIRLNQEDAQAYFNLGTVYHLTKRYADASQTLQEGLKREPNSAPGYYLLGSVLSRAGDFPAAERHLKTARDLDPKMSRVGIELANLYLRSERPQEAIREFENFVQLYPKDPLLPRVKETLKKLKRSTQ
ncbi:MAG: tetratricopeptide repeat protein [Acidobacteria bacterium]|nr:tetratricopeptide repeat protein [Acidobacteriota bacterium]